MNWRQCAPFVVMGPRDWWYEEMLKEVLQTSLEIRAGKAVYRFGIHPEMEIGGGENRE